jgi:hypothetical protein
MAVFKGGKTLPGLSIVDPGASYEVFFGSHRLLGQAPRSSVTWWGVEPSTAALGLILYFPTDDRHLDFKILNFLGLYLERVFLQHGDVR